MGLGTLVFTIVLETDLPLLEQRSQENWHLLHVPLPSIYVY